MDMVGAYTEFYALSPAAAMKRADQPARVFASSDPFLLLHPEGKGWGPKTQHDSLSPQGAGGHEEASVPKNLRS